MLQAQLLMAYTVAAQLTTEPTRRQFYAAVVADIVRYINRDLSHTAGGFFSAEDADSWAEAEKDAGTSSGSRGHKKEGAFCVWTAAEIRATLGDHLIAAGGGRSDLSLADIVIERYHVKEAGNVDPRGDPHGELRGQNVLTELPLTAAGKGGQPVSGGEPTTELLPGEPELYKSSLERGRVLLYERRLKRPRPDRDDKVGQFFM